MAEYYAVLSKAVAGLESNSADSRRAVYDKARNALIGQLKAIDPPLPTAEISRQRLELEEAIRRVERETSAVPSGAPVRVARPQSQVEAAPAVPRQSPQDVFRRAIQEAERGPAEPPRDERLPVARSDSEWADDAPAQPQARQPAYHAPRREPVEEEPPTTDGPQLAPDYDYDWEQNGEPKSGSGFPSGPYVDTRDRPAKVKGGKRRAGVRDDHDSMAQRARPSRLPMILLLVLIIGMLGGLGALAWSQRTVLSDLLASFDSGSQQAATEVPAPSVEAPAVDSSGKDTDRLLPGAVATGPANEVRSVTPQADTGNSVAGTSTDTAPAAAGGTAVASAAPAADADGLVAQRAVLYEEPLDQASAASGVVAINAAVTWTYNPNGIGGPEAVANLDVPERGMKIKVSFRRNADPTLPASHVVEVNVTTPPNFPGKSVKDVPRLVLKPSEDARGQPLIGASAKVADGFFWIALSGVDRDVATNVALMKDQGWIDLPLVYDTGQRAILTFEKGTPGERVFEKTLAAWAG
jgi:hypothetical protein